MTLPISTTNITGFLARVRGLSLRNESPSGPADHGPGEDEPAPALAGEGLRLVRLGLLLGLFSGGRGGWRPVIGLH